MSATYVFVPLPLDAAQADSPGFALQLISTIQFGAGETAGAEIAGAVGQHPLLGRDPALPLRALTMPYAAWTGVRQLVAGAPGVSEVQLEYRGKTSFADLRATLADYLARPGAVPVAKVEPDTDYDEREDSDFLDIAGAHDRLTELRASFGQQFAAQAGLHAGSLANLTDKSIGYAQRRWMNGAAQAAILASLFGDQSKEKLAFASTESQLVDRLRTDVARQRNRLAATPVPEAASNGFLASSSSGDVEIDPRDPNAAIHAALSNSLIAASTGMVTEWAVTGEHPLLGDHVIALDPSEFPAGTSIECKATAFRRQGTTHPLSVNDIDGPTTNNGLAALNGDGGGARYSATGVNAEVAFIQGTILQAGNSIANSPTEAPFLLGDGEARRDDRAPVELAERQLGYNELEAAGITISAPASDLTTPDALKPANRGAILPCLFLEDLWVGYRLDLAAEGRGRLRSVHRQQQRIKLSHSSRTLSGETEDFWPREAANVDPAQLSTEIIRYNGLSTAQALDYAAFLGTAEPPQPESGAPFKVDVEGAEGVTPLRFGETYNYRLRNVFQGGVSLADDDPGIAAFGPRHHQTVSFQRARSYRAGEIIVPDVADDANAATSIFLTDRTNKARILVVPTPVDADTARYNGQFLARVDEASRDAGRAFVTDLAGYFRAEGEKAEYYCDPDVAEIAIELWMRNGDPRSTSQEFAVQDGVFCERIEPLHVGPEIARFGTAGRWRDFSPIQIIVTSSNLLYPQIKVESSGRRVRVSVPVATEIELVLTPKVPVEAVMRSARFAPSNNLAPTNVAGAGIPAVEHRIRVVNCTRAPVKAPRIVSESNAPGGGKLALLKREPSTDRAELEGYVEVDAASSSELRIEASWQEIDDDPIHPEYGLKEGRSVSSPRSLQFVEHRPISPAMAVKMALEHGLTAFPLAEIVGNIGTQCAENRVFLGGFKPVASADAIAGSGDGAGEEAAPCVLALGNSRRALLSLTANATGRHSARFAPNPKKLSSRTSRHLSADVPASMELTAPTISHVMPLVREQKGRERGQTTRERVYAFRVYVRRPWFLSGPAERLAVGCHVGTAPSGPRDTLAKTFSQWGEDPIARTRADASKRLPRASDFRAAAGVVLDPVLYPPNLAEGRDPVLYFDNIIRPEVALGSTDDVTRLALASYALQWDQSQKLWFCDVELANDFTGWIGLALYRHQPHAHEGTQISNTSAWIYSQQFQAERITWSRQNGVTRVSIGPVFDQTISFAAEQRRYRDGVSVNSEQPPDRVDFKRVEVAGKIYFEGRFRDTRDLEIIRRRSDFDVASFKLEA